MIELKQVTKKYLRYPAVNNCTMSIEKGKVIGIVGENGSGKSTSLKLMAGLLKPTKGEVMVDGEAVTRKISQKLAYQTDSEYFYPFLTIQQLIDFYASQFSDFDKKKAQELIVFMKLDPTTKINYLSKGNLGRVKIVVTLSRNAPYLVLDEPFSGLDPMVRSAIVKGLIKFVDLNKQTLLLTTHEIRDVETILDEVILLKGGRAIAQQSIDAIREMYQMSLVDWMEYNYNQIETN